MRTENSVDTAKPTPVAVCATPSSAKEDVEKKKKKGSGVWRESVMSNEKAEMVNESKG